MTSVSRLWRWAVTSNEQAVENARSAATECSRRRVERAEVEQFLSAIANAPGRSSVEVSARAVATGH